MSNYKETAVVNVPKECFADIRDGSGFGEHIAKQLSSELAERIMGILEREDEIIVRQSDLRVSEFIPTQSVEYRRQINWSPLVRCKDCAYWGTKVVYANGERADCLNFNFVTPCEFFCKWGERREDGKTD